MVKEDNHLTHLPCRLQRNESGRGWKTKFIACMADQHRTEEVGRQRPETNKKASRIGELGIWAMTMK